MYVADDAADSLVAKDDKLQSAVQGRIVLLWLPGQTAAVVGNACLMFGWMGVLIASYRMFAQLKNIEWLLLAIAITGAPGGVAWSTILLGLRPARLLMHRYAMVSLGIGASIVCVALMHVDWVAVALSGVGLVAMVAAERIVAGPSYALFTAFFRAKRKHELSLTQKLID